MKILYLIDQDIHSGNTSGIIHKIKGKVDLWESLGHRVQILSLYSFKLYNTNLEIIDETKSFQMNKHSKIRTLLRLLKSSFFLYKYLDLFEFDFIYMRTRLYMPFTVRALKKHKIVMELNSDDIEEWKCNNKAIWIANNLTRHIFYRLASAYVSVSHELTDRYQGFKRRTLTIGNGISTKDYIFTEQTNNARPQICFVGSPGFKWHGIDKIEAFATKCPEFDFHFIGDDGYNFGNRKYYGYLDKAEVNEIVAKCDVAFSTMSLHVKNMEEASPLKSRQYLALGVPFIYAYEDTDLSGDEEFTLKLSNRELNIESSTEEIRTFVWKCFKDIELRKKARNFAEVRLNVSAKEESRLDFLSRVHSDLKILYIIDQNIEDGKTAGIIYKVRDQIRRWEQEGVMVQLLSLYNFKLYDSELNLLDDSHSFEIKSHNSFVTLFRLFYSTLKLVRHLGKFRFDMVYMRTRPYMPFTRWAFRNNRVMMELNTNDIEEWKSLNKIMHIYNLITRRWFYGLAMGYTTVGYEIRDLYQNFGKKIKVIGNAIRVSDYKLIEDSGNTRPRVCFVGSPGFPWHGIDKIKYLASKLRDVDFIFIGESGKDYENVKFHGYCDLDRVTELLHTCDLAIGTMSLHEKGMNGTSTIKTRQYLAQGLPIFYGYKETDFSGDEEFLLELPNTPTNIEENVDKIHRFIFHCFKNTELRIACRKFAEENLDVSIKEKERVTFIKEIYKESQT